MLNVSGNALYVDLHDEDPSTILGTAEIAPLPEGDIVVSLRRPGAHPDAEVAIVTIAVQADGSFRIVVMDGDTKEIGTIVTERRTLAKAREIAKRDRPLLYPEEYTS